MRSVAVLVALAATAVTAQVPKYNSSLAMTIDPNSVPQQQRAVWCRGQTNTCQQLCSQNTNDNSCDIATLSWKCTCTANNSAPGLQYFDQTIPTFICETLFSQCISQNAGSQSAQADCTKNIQDLCGTNDPPTETSPSDSSSAPPTSSATPTSAASGTHAAPTAEATTTATGTKGSANPAARDLPSGVTPMVAVAVAGLVAYLL